ncbi:MAG: PAS domain S-box protein, partial [Candidatus Marinimicrobia bacterium]|nr:PAS domain S-box protein [Candidatus Neomarinimicrobiota bacterium]
RAITSVSGEKKRQRHEDQLVQLMDFAPIGIVVFNQSGALLYANNTTREMWRRNTVADLENIKIFDIIHPDYKNFMTQRFKGVMWGTASDPSVIKILLPGKIEKSIEISTAPFQFSGQLCGVSVMQDVTHRLKSEEEQRLLATAIANTNDSIVITDRSGSIEYINPAFTRITGYSKEEALGQNPRIIQSGHHDKTFYKKMWATLRQGRVWEGRLVNRKKDETLYTELASISPVLNTTGEITHFVAVKRDISHEVSLESQLNQAQKMEAIGTLAGGIAHDFNNILGAIIGFTDLSIHQLPPDSPVHDNLLHIRSSGKRAADLIQQILTFSRQAIQQDKIPVDVVPLVKETLKLLRASIPTTINIQLNMAETEGWVLANPVQIQQIIMNLCTNAFHTMNDHGGDLTISLKRIHGEHATKETLPSSTCIELKVADTGKGIDRAIIERIFDPFFTTKGIGEGSGLGLSMVYGLVKQHGGLIHCESKLGEGTTFDIYFPYLDAHQSISSITKIGQNLIRGRENILRVEDDIDVLTILQGILESSCYTVKMAKNGKVAMDIIMDNSYPIDLVITDLIMPEMSGTELYKRVEHLPHCPKFLYISGYARDAEIKGLKLSPDIEFMKKPFTATELNRRVRKVIDRVKE